MMILDAYSQLFKTCSSILQRNDKCNSFDFEGSLDFDFSDFDLNRLNKAEQAEQVERTS